MVDADRNSPTISNTAEGERRSSVVPPKRLTRSQLRVLTLLANNRPIFTAGAFGETIATSVPYLKRFARPITLHILHNRGWIEPGEHWASWVITDPGRRRLDRHRERSTKRALRGKAANGGSVQ